MDEILKDLSKLGEALEVAKSKRDMNQGRLEEMYKSLKGEFNASSLKEAEEQVTSLEMELAEIECEIEEGYQNLKEGYDWE